MYMYGMAFVTTNTCNFCLTATVCPFAHQLLYECSIHSLWLCHGNLRKTFKTLSSILIPSLQHNTLQRSVFQLQIPDVVFLRDNDNTSTLKYLFCLLKVSFFDSETWLASHALDLHVSERCCPTNSWCVAVAPQPKHHWQTILALCSHRQGSGLAVSLKIYKRPLQGNLPALCPPVKKLILLL